MKDNDVKKISEILHAIFCGRKHEEAVERFEISPLCTFYIEQSIDRCWELREHLDWLDQARLFIQLCHPLSPVEILRDLIAVHKTAMKIKNVNPKLLNYVKIIFK